MKLSLLLHCSSGQNEDENVNAAVQQEAKEFGDILIGNFQDSYKNLVFKSLWLIEWAVNRLVQLQISKSFDWKPDDIYQIMPFKL